MTVFRFRFCNDLPNSTGHIFHTCQRQIEVHGLDCRDQAAEIAKRQFEQQEGICSHSAITIAIDEARKCHAATSGSSKVLRAPTA